MVVVSVAVREKKKKKKVYLRLGGVSVWQSPTLCPELLSHLGQSLKVWTISG